MTSNSPHYNYNHLSVKDLVEARDMFHVHLINKKNVVATAIGRYLIRTTDVDKNGIYKPQKNKPARTLENSVVMEISWPCLLVFVQEWAEEKSLIHENATDIIPKTIYMPDGRMAPICVVEAPIQKVTNTHVDVNKLRFPENLIGGGFPLFINSQGIKHIATVGCLVTDGHKYFALTNKHVSGIEGEKVKSVMGGSEVEIGFSSGKALGKVEFSNLYKGWQGNNILVSCDAGLIEVNDVSDWKTDVLDIGQMGEMYDLNTMNLTLGLISEHKVINGKRQASKNGLVVGYGAVSQKLNGEIVGLFYRYKSVGGLEYVSDLLISGRDGKNLDVHHGDSGTLWHIVTTDKDKKEILQPIALHWGQHEFIQGQSENKYSYSLSTCLSNVCRELDVELVRGWNIDNNYSWGKTGHYKIAARACEIVSNRKLKKLLEANKENISFTDDGMLNDAMKDAKWGQFCALADVPDIVWRMTRKADDANHFADMDESDPNVMGGKNLLELCKHTENIEIDIWNKYYEEMEGEDSSKSSDKRGALPFRVWQAFNLMVEYVKAGKLAEFICVGGTVSHYLGDACQPLHVSYLHHGHPGVDEEKKVHSIYETNMLDKYMFELIDGVNANHKTKQIYKVYESGKDAAKAVIKLMDKITTKILSPEEIIDCYNETDGRGRIDNMWNKLGDRTIQCVTEGSLNLALFWESAWKMGNGDKVFTDIKLKEIKHQKLMDLYMDKNFFPSYKMKDPKFKESLGS
jgi:hypothetical protein